MRIVSLLPSATEILFAFGFDREIVGVSHECDFPPEARQKRNVIRSRIPHDASSSEVDRLVRDYVARGESIYSVDVEALRNLAPDLIVTQDLCHVCAGSPGDLASALQQFEQAPQVLCLSPQTLSEVWRDILWLGEETSRGPRAEALLKKIGARLGALKARVENIGYRPRVVFIEWLQPFYVGGHWVPEMIRLAGGEDVFGREGTPSFQVTVQEVIEAVPDVLVIAPCGYSAEQAREEYCGMKFPAEWGSIPAVRSGRVFALEANAYSSRPGPRLITGIEALAQLFHPSIAVVRESSQAALAMHDRGGTSAASA